MDNPQNPDSDSESAGEVLEGVKGAEFSAAASLGCVDIST
jgi:hypothetical protein